MAELESKFEKYLKDPVFIEVLDIVKNNSKGRVWIIGGFLYKNLVSALYDGGRIYNYDIDFIVEERNDVLKEVPNWRIETNNYGSQNYVRDENKMSFTDIHKAIRVSGLHNPTIEEFIKKTPFFIPYKFIIDEGLDKLTITATKLASVFRKCFCFVFHIPTIIDRSGQEVNISAKIHLHDQGIHCISQRQSK